MAELPQVSADTPAAKEVKGARVFDTSSFSDDRSVGEALATVGLPWPVPRAASWAMIRWCCGGHLREALMLGLASAEVDAVLNRLAPVAATARWLQTSLTAWPCLNCTDPGLTTG